MYIRKEELEAFEQVVENFQECIDSGEQVPRDLDSIKAATSSIESIKRGEAEGREKKIRQQNKIRRLIEAAVLRGITTTERDKAGYQPTINNTNPKPPTERGT